MWKIRLYSIHFIKKNFCKMAYKSSMSCPSMKRYLVSNDTISAILKFNKYKTCQQKIFTSLTNEKHVLICSFFLIHISYLLYFDMNDMVSLDTKYFFHDYNPLSSLDTNYYYFFFFSFTLKQLWGSKENDFMLDKDNNPYPWSTSSLFIE